MPRHDRFSFLEENAFSGKARLGPWVDGLLTEMESDEMRGSSQAKLQKTCELAIRSRSTTREEREQKKREWNPSCSSSLNYYNEDHLGSVSDDDLGDLVKGILQLERPDLMEKIATLITEALPEKSFRDLGEGIAHRNIGLWQDR